MPLATHRSLPSAANTHANTNAGVAPHFARVALLANLGTRRVVRASSRCGDRRRVLLWHERRYDAGADGLVPRQAQRARRSFGERGAVCGGATWGRGMAAASRRALVGRWRRRVGRDCADGRRIRDRDEDQNLRWPPSGSGARAGGVTVAAPAKVGTQSRPGCPLRCSRAGRQAGGARCSRGLGRPVDARPSCRGPDRVEAAVQASDGESPWHFCRALPW